MCVLKFSQYVPKLEPYFHLKLKGIQASVARKLKWLAER